MMKKLYTFLALALLTLPNTSLAQLTVRPPNQGLKGNLETIIQRFIEVAIMLGGVAFLAMLIAGGFQYLTASGDQTQAQKANKTIMYGAIGLFIVATAFVIARFVAGDILGIDVFGQ